MLVSTTERENLRKLKDHIKCLIFKLPALPDLYGFELFEIDRYIKIESEKLFWISKSEEELVGVVEYKGIVFPVYDLTLVTKITFNIQMDLRNPNLIFQITNDDATFGLLINQFIEYRRLSRHELQINPIDSLIKHSYIQDNGKRINILNINELYSRIQKIEKYSVDRLTIASLLTV